MKREVSALAKQSSWICAMAMFLIGGCVERDKLTAPAGAKVPDLRETIDGMAVSFFDSSNPYTARVLYSLVRRPAVKAEMVRFTRAGYRYDPETSFVNEGALVDGRHVRASLVSLRNDRKPDQDAVFLFCLSERTRFAAVPVHLCFNAGTADADAMEIGEGVWMSVIEPLDAAFGPDVAAFRWNWRRWSRCVGHDLIAGGSGCASGCRFANVGYFQCLAICSGTIVLGSVLGCSFMELF